MSETTSDAMMIRTVTMTGEFLSIEGKWRLVPPTTKRWRRDFFANKWLINFVKLSIPITYDS